MKSIIVDNHLITPSKIVCIGRNYVDHITELGNEIPDEMVVFNKPNSAISSKLLSHHQEQLHYESELCFVIKNGQICAVGFGLDITKRFLQSKLKTKGLPWERAKAFNGSAVFSNFLSIKQDQINETLSLELSINDEIVQRGGIELMIYKPADIIVELKIYTDLEDGDIIMTGTPKGVGLIVEGAYFKGRVLSGANEIVSASWIAS
ncbi:MAG: fumarylacetoacetate hydrolase family protein [Colwellia sp.]|nr:fumarylacetoacetate hydrolase family protein [Colwellia sp.]